MILVFAVGMTYGQTRTQLKGPKAKNYKPWKADQPASYAIATLDVERAKGPKAKNARVWSDENQVQETGTLATTNRAKLKGPKAKNRNSWEADSPRRRGYLVERIKETEPLARD